MTSEHPSDLHAAVRERYRAVAEHPAGQFPYPVGRESAEGLGYEARHLDAIPAEVVERFVGVGNPFQVHRPDPGDRVIDLGCGAGLDSMVAAQLVGPVGHVLGIDLTPEMLEVARSAHARAALPAIDWTCGAVESLDRGLAGAFDVAVSNGVLNLVPDKDATFLEIARVLKPGGWFAVADLLVIDDVPAEVLADLDAWSSWIAGALPGTEYLAKLEAAGFVDANILGPTGYVTSQYTAAFHIRARRA